MLRSGENGCTDLKGGRQCAILDLDQGAVSQSDVSIAACDVKQEAAMVTNSDRLALRQDRIRQSPVMLRGGFRPFFLGAASWAVIVLLVWLGFLFRYVSPDLLANPIAWHRHEMVFGFAGAAMAGFALTAVPNWTGRLPIAGTPLAMLAAFWAAARILPFVGSWAANVGPFVDGAFYLALAAILGREIAQSRNRNIPVAAGIALFGFFAAIDGVAQAGLIGVTDLGWRGGYAVIIMMIGLIGGRIIPSFTHNWLAKHGLKGKLSAQTGRYDLILLALTGVALLAYLIAAESGAAGWLLMGAGLGHAIRLMGWQGWRAARDPLVAILHLGYFWLSLGVFLLGWSVLGGVPQVAALHALGAGAMATMILAVMSRATLGHTGRELRADGLTVASYILITIAAVARVLAGFSIGDPQFMLAVAGTGWIGAFGLFCIGYGPKLCAPRIDGRP
ncbi:short-chain dehydrogenase [Aurantiacibacter atlanticus]|uniref:Short-chain dehydrogenase n=2 Tax=Aurantiacibacter atlanticus TaxID=1648404 RepID=A0A0H4VKD7_9SPHN|nr:short-chain dehydrogenase [Aurantiacibacter atlanticus]